MCNFFSLCSDGQGSYYYFNFHDRYLAGDAAKWEVDSHASIAAKFNKDEDRLNKYEYNPKTGKFSVDQINACHDDREAVEKFVRALDFQQIDPFRAGLGWPEGLNKITGSLDLQGIGITSLPEGLSVGGSLYLRGTGITSLPKGLSVGGSLDLEGTGITSLPEGLSVGGDLYLRGTGITSLPEGLSVGGSLYLWDTGITSLPEGLSVGGFLYLRGTGIKKSSVPKHLKNKAIF